MAVTGNIMGLGSVFASSTRKKPINSRLKYVIMFRLFNDNTKATSAAIEVISRSMKIAGYNFQ